MQSKFTKSILSMLLVVVFVSFTFTPQDTKAQGEAPLIAAQTFWQKAEAFAGKTIRRIFSQTYRNFMRRMMNNLAVQAAKKIATGQKGKLSLFPGEGMLGALENEFYASVGNFLEEYDKMFGGLLCNPDEALKFAIAINLPGVQGGQMMGPTKSKCDLRDVKGRWKKFGAATSKNLARKDFNEYVKINMASQFDEGNNDFGVFLKVNEEFQKKTGIDSKQNLLVSALEKLPGYQGISDAVKDTGGRLQNAPGAGSDFQKNVNQGIFQEMFTTTQDIVVDAMNVFTNTLISEYLKRLLADPAFKNPATSRGTYRNFKDLLRKPTGTEQETFIEKSFAKPVIYQSTSSYDPLADLVTCPDDTEQKTSLNCSMTQELHEAVRMKEGTMTLKQAIEEGAIKPDAVIGFMSKGVPPSSPDQGFSEDALINLRKFRILPVGFELVASEIKKGNIVAPVTVKQALDCFNPDLSQDNTCKTFDAVATAQKATTGSSSPKNPLYHMIDPNWVITIPDMICKAQVYGKELQSSQGADRRQYCADVKDCVAKNEKGTCLEYGNCLTEVSTWTFKNGTCPSHFASCESWIRESDGKDVSYIMDSVDSGNCSENSGGCGWISLSKDSSGYDWTDASRIYLNRDAQNDTCSSADAGCTAYRSITPGAEMIYNGDFNISTTNNHTFDLALNPITYGDSTIPDGWSWNTSIEYGADGGSNNSKAIRFTGSGSIYQDVELVPSSTYQLSAFISGGSASVSVYNIANGTETTLLSGSSGCDGNSARITSTNQCVFTTGASGSVRIKLSGSGGAITDSVSVVSLSDLVDSTSYISYDQNPKAYIKPSSQICDRASIGCAQYSDVEGTTPPLFAVVRGTDMCPAECVGFSAFEEVLVDNEEKAVMQSIGEVINSNNTITRFMSPPTASICQATEVGCEEYTNLGVSGEGGESLEYYSKITSCVPENQGTTFYTWEGSDSSGFVIKVWNALKHDSGRPCTSLNGDVCAGSETCSNTADPSCRTFYNEEGSSFNIDVNRLVYAVNDCREYRRTRPVVVSTGGNVSYKNDDSVRLAQGAGIDDFEYIQPILKFSPTLSAKCSESANGCHEYRGTASSNVALLPINGSFETNVDGWSVQGVSGGRVRQSTESITTGGHSLEMNNITGALVATLAEGSVKAGDKLAIEFWAKVGAVVPEEEPLTQLEAENTTVVTIPVNAGVITNDGAWHRYTLNTVTVPNTVTEETPTILSFDFSNTDERFLYIDTITVKRTIDSLYLVANSWDQELTSMCINFVGCREYKTGTDSNVYTYKFDHLCKEEFVGCDAFINTHNSSVPYAQKFNTDTVSAKDDYVVQADSIEYRVADDSHQCSSDMAGCTEVGAPTIDQLNNTVTSYTTGYIKIRPDYFDSSMCSEDTLFCEAYSKGPNKVYFKDPGNNVCTYIENIDIDGSGIKKSGWYKQGTDSTWFDCLPGDVRACSAQFNGCSELLYKPYVDKSDLNLCYGKGGEVKTGVSSLLACEGKGGVDSVWCSPCNNTTTGKMIACVKTQSCPSGSTKSSTQACVNSYGRIIEGVLNENECVGAEGMWEHNTSYYVLSDRFTFEGCGNNWSEEDGCVQFFNKSNARERIVIKADLDRQCTSWLACRDSAITVGSDGRAREICNKLGTCTKYDVNNPSKCAYDGWAKYECTGGKCDDNPSVSCSTNTDCESVLLSYSDQDSKYRSATNGRWGVPNYSGASIPDMYPISRMTQVVYDGVCVKEGTQVSKQLCRMENNNDKVNPTSNSDCATGYICQKEIPCFGEYPCVEKTTGHICNSIGNIGCVYRIGLTYGLSYLSVTEDTKIDKGVNGFGETGVNASAPVRVEKDCRAYPESNSPFAPEMSSKNPNTTTFFEHKNFLKYSCSEDTSGKKVCTQNSYYDQENDLYQNADCSYVKGRSRTGNNIYFDVNYSVDTERKISAGDNDQADEGFKIGGLSIYQGWKGYCLQSYDGYSYANCAYWYPVDIVGGEVDISTNAPEAGLDGQPYGNKELSYCVETDHLKNLTMPSTDTEKIYCLEQENVSIGRDDQLDSDLDYLEGAGPYTRQNACRVALFVSNPNSNIASYDTIGLAAPDKGVVLGGNRRFFEGGAYPEYYSTGTFDQTYHAQHFDFGISKNMGYDRSGYERVLPRLTQVPTYTQQLSDTCSGVNCFFNKVSQPDSFVNKLKQVYNKGIIKSFQRGFDVRASDADFSTMQCEQESGFAFKANNAHDEIHWGDCKGGSDCDIGELCVPNQPGVDGGVKYGSGNNRIRFHVGYGRYHDVMFNYGTPSDGPDGAGNNVNESGMPDGSSYVSLNTQTSGGSGVYGWDRTINDPYESWYCNKLIRVTDDRGRGPVDTNIILSNKQGSGVYMKPDTSTSTITGTSSVVSTTAIIDSSTKTLPVSLQPFGTIGGFDEGKIATNFMCKENMTNYNNKNLSPSENLLCSTYSTPSFSVVHPVNVSSSDISVYKNSAVLDKTIFARVFDSLHLLKFNEFTSNSVATITKTSTDCSANPGVCSSGQICEESGDVGDTTTVKRCGFGPSNTTNPEDFSFYSLYRTCTSATDCDPYKNADETSVCGQLVSTSTEIIDTTTYTSTTTQSGKNVCAYYITANGVPPTGTLLSNSTYYKLKGPGTQAAQTNNGTTNNSFTCTNDNDCLAYKFTSSTTTTSPGGGSRTVNYTYGKCLNVVENRRFCYSYQGGEPLPAEPHMTYVRDISYPDNTQNLNVNQTWPILRAAITDGDHYSEGEDGSVLINNIVLKDGGNPEVLSYGTRDVVMKFFGFSPKGRHMPLRNIVIDWGDTQDKTSFGKMSKCSTEPNNMPKRCFVEDDCTGFGSCIIEPIESSIKNKRAQCDPTTSGEEWGGNIDACDSQIPFTFAHTYMNSGPYTIKVRLYDNWGAFGSVQKTIVIPDKLPVGGASQSQQSQ